MSYAIRCAVLILAATACLNAQRGGNSGGGNSGASPGGNTGGNTGGNSGGNQPTPAAPVQPQFPQQQVPNPAPQIQIPIFLAGKVMLDDGGPLPTNITIQRTCSMQTQTVAYADPRGQFNFQIGGRPAAIIPDASEGGPFAGVRSPDIIGGNNGNSESSGFGGSRMFGCELSASAPGFRSERLDLSNHRASDNPDVGIILLHRLANVEGTSVSATSFNAPKDARKAWEKGSQLLHKSKSADAEKELQKAVDLYPKYASAWLDLGRARLLQQNFNPAREAFLKATEADGKLVEPYVALGELAMRDKNWPDAAKYLNRALQLDPVDYPKLWLETAVADYNSHNFESAEKNARAAVKVNSPNRNPLASQLLGFILLNKHDLPGARDALRDYVKLAPDAKDLNQMKAQLAEIEGQLPTADAAGTKQP